VLVFHWSTSSPTHTVGLVLGRQSVFLIALELESTIALYYQTRPAVSRLNCTQLSACLLTCHSLACDTRERAQPWSVECVCGCRYVPLCTDISRSSTNTYTRANSSPLSLSGTRQPTAVYWMRPPTHECALLLFTLHSLYHDSGVSSGRILKNPLDPDVNRIVN